MTFIFFFTQMEVQDFPNEMIYLKEEIKVETHTDELNEFHIVENKVECNTENIVDE